MLYLVSFISALLFSTYKSFVPLGRFVPRYFLFFSFFLFVAAMVNGIISLNSHSYFSLLVYRNARDFSVLILYPVALLNSLMNASSFLVAFLGFSMYSTMSSANGDSCTSFFPTCIHFFFCSECHG